MWSRSERILSFDVDIVDRNKSAAPCESTTFWPLWWRISLSIRVQTTLNHCQFVELYFTFTRICKSSSVAKYLGHGKQQPFVCFTRVKAHLDQNICRQISTLPVFFYLVLSSFSRTYIWNFTVDKEVDVINLFTWTRKSMIFQTHLRVLDYESDDSGEFFDCFVTFVHLMEE